LEAFTLAVRLGATGIESDVWLTRDGEAVLDHDGVVGGRLRRRPIATCDRADLPDHIPTLAALYEAVGTELDISLDVKDPDAFDRTVEVAAAAGDGVLHRLWLCYPRWERVAAWRQQCAEVRLVDSTFLGYMTHGPEQRAAALADAGIDAVNLHHTEWTGGLTTLFHRFELVCLGWDAQLPRHLAELLDMGIDGVFSDHVDRMMEAIEVELGSSA
jgi:glycerophosphoryl diester phosphodiesterase